MCMCGRTQRSYTHSCVTHGLDEVALQVSDLNPALCRAGNSFDSAAERKMSRAALRLLSSLRFLRPLFLCSSKRVCVCWGGGSKVQREWVQWESRVECVA